MMASAEGSATINVFREVSNREQRVYDSSNFLAQDVGQPIVINSVEFLLQGGLLTNITTDSLVEIHLQDSALDHTALSMTFASNRTSPLGPRTSRARARCRRSPA